MSLLSGIFWICYKVVPHVLDQIRQHHRFWWKLVELLYKECAIGITVLFYKNGDVTAPSREHAKNRSH